MANVVRYTSIVCTFRFLISSRRTSTSSSASPQEIHTPGQAEMHPHTNEKGLEEQVLEKEDDL